MPAIRPVLLLLLAAAACGPAPALRPAGGGWGDTPAVSEKNYILQDQGQFALTGQESLEEAGAIIQSALAGADGEGDGGEKQDLKIYSGAIIGLPRGAVVLTQDGLADDSLRSAQHVVEFDVSKETEAVSATAYGIRYRCRRAADPDAWTTRPCP